MPKPRVLLGDLTHTAQGISALTFPLGTAYITAYARRELGEHFDFDLIKWPETMAKRVLEDRPKILAFSNYSWNLQISYALSEWAKRQIPGLIVIFGGPNFPVDPAEKLAFLQKYPAIDFHIENEGEIGFSKTLAALLDHGLDPLAFKRTKREINNCAYEIDGALVQGKIERILDVNDIPSPYLTGVLDAFFEDPLVPMLETARGCPFSCSFCSDGMASKNKVTRFDFARTRAEIDYIAARVRRADELIITDLNFGMYKQDRDTAEYLAALQAKQKWPVLVKGSAGKNQPDRVIEIARILKGSFLIGSAMQSSDPEVLANIKRSNISTAAYQRFIETANQEKDSQSYSEIILALPGDTKQKHFQSLKTGVDAKVSAVRMYQAMLLSGTDMATPETRARFGLLTKFRIIPGNIGVYRFGEDKIPIAEIEEIVVGSKDMPFEDYVECRIMNLLVETYINNDLFAEIFSSVAALGESRFDVLVYLLNHRELFTPRMTEIIQSFTDDTVLDLYDSFEEAQSSIRRAEIMHQYAAGELGNNELLAHRAALYLEFDDIADVLRRAVMAFLAEKLPNVDQFEPFFNDLTKFIICRKKAIHAKLDRIEEKFAYDLAAINDADFTADPRLARPAPKPQRIAFFHDDLQKKHITRSYELYKNHPGGLGRMIQRSNLKMMYRHFERA